MRALKRLWLTLDAAGSSLQLSFLKEAWGLRERRSVEKVVGHATGASPSREAVIQALDNCYDPCCQDRKISVVDMGLIESIDIDARQVKIEMVLTTGWCPFASRLLEMVHEEVGSLAAVDNVDVEVVWDPTWTPDRMSNSAREKLTMPLEKLAPLREERVREAQLRGESA
jgi:metal-sulfur cluster biosynthetic enzyme